MKYLGPLRVISNVETSKIGPYINLARNQIGMQKSSNSKSVKSHYRNVLLPDGTRVETWYSFNNYSCNITVPGIPAQPVEEYIPGIIMAPESDEGNWGYASPFEVPPLGTALTTEALWNSAKFRSTLAESIYFKDLAGYEKTEFHRPWKHKLTDPRLTTKATRPNRIAYPVLSSAGKFLGNLCTSPLGATTFWCSNEAVIGFYTGHSQGINMAESVDMVTHIGSCELVCASSDRIGIIYPSYVAQSIVRYIDDAYSNATYLGNPIVGSEQNECTVCSYFIQENGDKLHLYYIETDLDENGVGLDDDELLVSVRFYNITDNPKKIGVTSLTPGVANYNLIHLGRYPDIWCRTLLSGNYRGQSAYGFLRNPGDRTTFYGYRTQAYLPTTNYFGNAMKVVWTSYTVSEQTVTEAPLFEYEPLATVYRETRVDYEPGILGGGAGSREWSIDAYDSDYRFVGGGNTFKGDVKAVYVREQLVSCEYLEEWTAVMDGETPIGASGAITSAMEGHTYYRIPNGAGGELTIQCNHTYSNNKTSLWMNDLTDPVIEGTETYTTEHIRFIDFDYYSDTYVYATISLTATKIWPDTPTWTYSGTIDLYRNTELFYSYELTNSTMNLRQSNQLPWLPECWVNTTQPGIQYIFEFLLDRELPWLDDAEWTSEDYVNTVYTRNYFFDTPTRLEEFTFNRGEMDTESSPPVRRAYRFPCRTVVNPGEDLSDADLITTICYQEMEEGNMETPQYVYKTWWNHTGPNSETLEEMLLISDKTNPRITNFGVI